MSPFRPWETVRRTLVLAGAVLLISACATVAPDDLDTELDRIRAEMREADEEVEARLGQRIDELERRMDGRLSSVEGDLRQLRDEFGATVERLESAVRFNAPIHFDFDQHEVRADARPVLDRFAEVIGSYYQEAVITVEGFTDTAGSREYNQRLGQRRAEAVREYLANAGIPEDRMRAVSYGEASNRLVAPNERGPGQEGWQNRRVALVVDFNPAR
jgi:peptidoglycan-associated lipoprotein